MLYKKIPANFLLGFCVTFAKKSAWFPLVDTHLLAFLSIDICSVNFLNGAISLGGAQPILTQKLQSEFTNIITHFTGLKCNHKSFH